MRYLIAIICLVQFNLGFSQLESNHWYFGLGAGVIFDNYEIAATTNSISSNGNGAATMSNSNGELLYYYGRDPVSFEKAIYNRNHEPMPNANNLFDDIG